MPFAFIVGADGNYGGGGNSPASTTTGAVDTTGADFLVVEAQWYPGITSDVVLSDSKGNTWTPLTKRTIGNLAHRMWWCAPTSVGSGHTFTVAATETYASLGAMALSGAHASPFGAESGATFSSDPTVQPGSLTPAEDNCLVIAATGAAGGLALLTDVTADGGFTDRPVLPTGGVNTGGAIAYLIQTSAAAANPTLTYDVTPTDVIAASAWFKAAGGPPAGDGAVQIAEEGMIYTPVMKW